MPEQLVGVLCRLQRSTFEEERVFRFRRRDGAEYIGISPIRYCHHPDGGALKVGEPESGEQIDGLVDARLVQNGGTEVWVSLPTGETILVPADIIRYRKVSQESTYVLVGP
jgi:hypothetical protein